MLIFRPTVLGDLHSLTVWESEQDTSPWLGETGHDWHSRALADPDQEHVIAVDDAGPVGSAVLAGLRKAKGIGPRRMAVLSARRGKGHGRVLLRSVLERAYRHHQAQTVWLDVKSHNHRARALYESTGFVAEETRRNAIAEPDGTASDLIIMVHRPSEEMPQSSSENAGGQAQEVVGVVSQVGREGLGDQGEGSQ